MSPWLIHFSIYTIIRPWPWNKERDGTIYAYWEKTEEKTDLPKEEFKEEPMKEEPEEPEFSSDLSVGTLCFTDIVWIFPSYGIYDIGDSYYSHFVCECKTKTGAKVWLYMPVSTYKLYFDSSASTSVYTQYANGVDLYPAKHIHGKVKMAKDIVSGLSSTTGSKVIEFISMD